MSVTNSQPLRVTAYSVLSALGATREDHLSALSEGRTGLGPAPMPLPFDTAVGEVRTPLPELPAELAVRSTRIARMAAHLVNGLEEPLRLARERYAPDRIGIFLGTSTAGAEMTERAYKTFVEEGAFPVGYDFKKQHTFGAVLHVVAALTGVTGPACMTSTACTSSGKTFASAQRLINAGIIDAAIVGGLDTLCSLTLLGFNALQALDTRICRPFHPERNGINIGEGGAFALVERAGDARMLIAGIGETSDAYHISAPHPEGRGAFDAMGQAMARAGCKPEDVDHVNAHGTGTRLNDSAEAKAILRLMPAEIPVVSTKGFTGHTLGAAAALEFSFAAMAIEEGWIPPSLGADILDPEIHLNVSNERRMGNFKRIISNSFAFGGNNVSLLVQAP
jgi:3-oxoacyl-[acyl-carrier-protein] synthase-1